MAGTQIRADRSTIVVDGSNKYQIIATCLLKGTLPDTGIFLLRIEQATDPKNDTLQRIIAIGDTVTHGTDRDAAVAAGATAWRSAQVTLIYDDIQTANSAWVELSARINKLVTDVDTYLGEFETFDDGELVVFPTTDQVTKDKLIADFLATAEDITTAEEARDAEQEECNDLQAEITVLDERIVEARADLDLYLTISGQLGAYTTILASVQGTLAAQENAAQFAVQSSSATAGEKTIIDSYFVTMAGQLTTFNTTNSALNGLQSGQVGTAVSTLQSRVSTLTTTRNTRASELNRCNAETQALQAALDRARAARDAALAAVRAVCPDYVPPTGT
jgi:hypothetical protein